MWVVVFLVFGLACGGLAWFWAKSLGEVQSASLSQALVEKNARITQLQEDLQLSKEHQGHLQEQLQNSKIQLAQVQKDKEHLNNLKAEYERFAKWFEEGQQQMEESLKKSAQEVFENRASKLLEHTSQNFSQKAQADLQHILRPFKDQVSSFEKRVNDVHSESQNNVSVLKGHIDNLVQFTQKQQSSTEALTRALKGNSKVQGDWGETLLEKLLEDSGLQNDIHYTKQQSVQSQDGHILRPDVVVHFPDKRNLVIDSKVSLTAYERYTSAESEEAKKTATKEHVRSLEQHVKALGEKSYAHSIEGNKVDFVFMFVPIEPAYLLAAHAKPGLIAWAWNGHGVALVTHTTLMATLRIVESLWKLDSRNKNAEEIAKEAAGIYDKFRVFLEGFEELGKCFQTGQEKFVQAKSRLCEGKGNIYGRLEKIETLGAPVRKQIR